MAKGKPYRIYRYEWGTLTRCFDTYDTLQEALDDWSFKMKARGGNLDRPTRQYLFVYHESTTIGGSRIIGYGKSNLEFVRLEEE